MPNRSTVMQDAWNLTRQEIAKRPAWQTSPVMVMNWFRQVLRRVWRMVKDAEAFAEREQIAANERAKLAPKIAEIERLTGNKVYVGNIAGTDGASRWACVKMGEYTMQVPGATDEVAVDGLLDSAREWAE